MLSEALDSEFSVGEILPNERDLAARFGVARATLRQALEQLELEGRLQRRRGVGTTVAPPRMGVSLGTGPHTWPGGSEDAWQPVDCAAAVPSAAVAEALETGRDEAVHVVRRSRVSNGRPVAAELLYIPRSSVPSSPVSTRRPERHARVRCCVSCSGWSWSGRRTRWSSAPPGRTTRRSWTGFPGRPFSW
ncbi:hypothetical protein SPURM210S_02531 [Streptomyces purpurascens]